jgi:polysaccharide biosynthesis transport protein
MNIRRCSRTSIISSSFTAGRKLEAGASENAQHVEVLEAAAAPQEPIFPLYARAGISVGGSLALGFLAVWFVEFFTRPEPAAGAGQLQPWWPIPVDLEAVMAQRRLPAVEPMQLAAPDATLRELAQSETAALLRAATGDGRLVLAALFSGLSTEEIVALTWEQIDLDTGAINLPGKSARLLRLTSPLRFQITVEVSTPQMKPAGSYRSLRSAI